MSFYDLHFLQINPSNREIRILDLQPSKTPTAPLQGRLQIVSLLNKPQFEALSYTWQEPFSHQTLPKGTIEIRGYSTPVSITGNLSDALRRMRLLKRPRAVWIDAICINQEDDQERSQQVAMMSEIYSCATQVIAWLGEESPHSDGHFLASIYDTIQEGKGHQHQHPGLILTSPQARTFLSRRYFTRRWIIQELTHARQVILAIGPVELTWRWFCAIFTSHLSLAPQNEDLSNFVGYINILNRLRSRSGGAGDVFAVLCTFFQDLQCIDPRDRICALMSVWKGPVLTGFEADYSISTTELYCKFARALMRQEEYAPRTLWLAAFQAERGWRTRDLPSWVPDWEAEVIEPPDRGKWRSEVKPRPTTSQGVALSLPFHGEVGRETMVDIDSRVVEVEDHIFEFGLEEGRDDRKRGLVLRPSSGCDGSYRLAGTCEILDRTSQMVFKRITII